MGLSTVDELKDLLMALATKDLAVSKCVTLEDYGYQKGQQDLARKILTFTLEYKGDQRESFDD